MYQFIGMESGKVYSKGKSKAECFRKLHKKYPYQEVNQATNRKINMQRLYPEALLITHGNISEEK